MKKTFISIFFLGISMIKPLSIEAQNTTHKLGAIATQQEKDELLRQVRINGYFKFDPPHDAVDSLWELENKKAFNRIGDKNVSLLKVYKATLKKRIRSYTFADSFSTYFQLDTPVFYLVFFTHDPGLNIFGTCYPYYSNYNKFWSTTTANEPTLYTFLEQKRSDAVFVVLKDYAFVENDVLYSISNGNIIKGSKFFSKFTFDELNYLFIGLLKDKIGPILLSDIFDSKDNRK